VKKVFMAFIVSIFLLMSHSMYETVYTLTAEPIESSSEILRGTFYELVLSELDSRFVSVSIRDNYSYESIFSERSTITRRAEVRRMLNVLGDAQLVSMDRYYLAGGVSPIHGIRLEFSERRGIPGTEVTSPWGVARDQLNVTIFPEQGLMSVLFNNNFPAYYFHFDEADIEELLDVSPLSLLNHGTPVAFFALFVAMALLLRYWFGGDQYVALRKAVSVRNYIVSVWATLFFIASLMVDNNHPEFLLWLFRAGFLAFSVVILWHSKKYELRKIMLWEILGIGSALAMAFILSSPATVRIAYALRFMMSNVVALLIIGVPIYMLFSVVVMRHTPSHQRIRTRITIIVTAVATILFFLLLFYPHVFNF